MPYATLKAHHDELETKETEFRSWQYPLLTAPCRNLMGCLYGCCCPCCFGYQQRERILKITGEPYRPCGGSLCCCKTPEIVGSPQREIALCCETFCCTNVAILVNRDLIMYNFTVNFDPVDEYIISCVICLDCIFGILAMFDESFRDLSDMIDLLLLIIMGCSLAQQESMLDVVTETPTLVGGKFRPDKQPGDRQNLLTNTQESVGVA